MPNRLAHESSPYLLQHAQNPVDWHPWDAQALDLARRQDKPIFLSIGYSACHWCHVMEHESFENEAIARQMNAGFVNVKVDREERPDLDQIYMHAVQLMTGRGGWPMSVFLTPDRKPFFGGTYWPPSAGRGMPGFDQVLAGVLDAWRNRRPAVYEQADRLTEHLLELGEPHVPHAELNLELLRGVEGSLARAFDGRNGGFGGAPKFPHPMDLRLLLRLWRRDPQDYLLRMATFTLDNMSAGGIYDQLGGGFHRYSVDARWLVPHFEKMLYDNALLAGCLVEAWQATGNDDYARTARETCDYVLREMTDSAGGFYSTQDADSEGEEGKFYVWTPAEIRELLGPAAAETFCRCYDVSDAGNFEGHNILNRPKTLSQCAALLGRTPVDLEAELAASRGKLLAARNRRVWPNLDDKVLVSWNGLTIDALAQAAAAFDEPAYLAAATKAADFILQNLRRPDGSLLHVWRRGRARLDAYLDDYACLANACVTLYEAGFDERWIETAIALADAMLARFADPAGGGFFYTAHDHEPLIARPKDIQDSSVPSGNAMAATALLRLGTLCGRTDLCDAAERVLVRFAGLMERAPTAAGQLLLALDFHLGPTHQVVWVGEQAAAAPYIHDMHRRFWPRKAVAHRPGRGLAPALDPLFAGKETTAAATLYVCEQSRCQAPATGQEAILATLERYAPGKQGK